MEPKVPTNFSFFPEQASTFASAVDNLYLYLVAISVFFCIAIPLVIVIFTVIYRRRPGNERPPRIETSKTLEIVWSVIPLGIVLTMFFWGADVYLTHKNIPKDATEILVTGKKWMWKFQHLNGRREINDLHIPVNTPIKLKMASEDVIHSVFVPAFRTKQDVMPGRYTYMWFEATKPGVYHLFCNQYCGTSHSKMVGKVIVMEKGKYEKWLNAYEGVTPASEGEMVFKKFACNTCHATLDTGTGPSLVGLYNKEVLLGDGQKVVADENYIRESIIDPRAKIVHGFQPFMPEYRSQLSQEQVNDLVTYIKSLQKPEATVSAAETNVVDNTTSASAPTNDGQNAVNASPNTTGNDNITSVTTQE